MRPVLRACLLVGCLAVSLLNAPQAAELIAQGLAGPYGVRTEAGEREGSASEATAQARLPVTTESLRVLGNAGNSLFLGEEPWRMGLPGGL